MRLDDIHGGPFDSAATLGGALAVFAAIFPEVVSERTERAVVGRVEDGLPLSSCRDEAGIDQAIEMVVQRRPRDIEPLLQLGDGQAIGAGLDDGPQERDPRDMAQRSELLGVAFQFAHTYVSSFIDSLSQIPPLEPRAPSTRGFEKM
jgi:hypothetical protein